MSLAVNTLRPFLLHRIDVGHYAVHLREQPWLLIGHVKIVKAGPDAGLWEAIVWSERLNRFSARSEATFTCRWEAVGFLARYRARALAKAKEIA